MPYKLNYIFLLRKKGKHTLKKGKETKVIWLLQDWRDSD